MRFLLSLVLLCLPAGLSAADIKIAWYGQSMFEIVSPKGTRIVIDPHNIEAYRVTPLKADLVLMSHLHSDHTRTEVIENIKDAKQVNALKKSGPGGFVIEWNLVDEKFKDVRYQSIATYHDGASGIQRGKNGCWILDIDGVRIVHLGDLGHALNKLQLKKLGSVDVLMVPVGGVYTINGIEAFRVCEQIKPKRCILPMHYGTIVYDDLLPLKYFSDECKDKELTINTLKPKQWLTIDPKAKPPEKPTVEVLSYFGSPTELKGKKDKEK